MSMLGVQVDKELVGKDFMGGRNKGKEEVDRDKGDSSVKSGGLGDLL